MKQVLELPDRESKITIINVLETWTEKGNSVHDHQVGNFSREMETAESVNLNIGQ